MSKKNAIIILAIIVALAGVFIVYLLSVMSPIGQKAKIAPKTKKTSQPMTAQERQQYIEDNLVTIPMDPAEAKAREEFIKDNLVTIPMDPAEAKAREEFIEDNLVTVPIE